MSIKHLFLSIGLGLGMVAGLLWLLAGFTPAAHADPAVLFVVPNGTGDCSQSNPCALQTALTQAQDGDTIYLAQGTYTGTGAAVITVTKSITLYGGWDGTTATQPVRNPDAYPTTLDGENVRRGVYAAGSITITLDGLRVTRGNATGLGGGKAGDEADVGGGIYVYTATVTIRNCTIYSNTASINSDGYGGGIYAREGRLTLTDSTVQSNTATTSGPFTKGYGGGLALEDSPYAVLDGNLIQGNYGLTGSGDRGHGGGVAFLYSEYATLNANTVLSNTAGNGDTDGYGGGLYFWHSGFATLTDNLVQGNIGNTGNGGSGGNGGGLDIQYSDHITLTGNTVRDNVASQSDYGYGGGLSAYSQYLTLSGNTFADNTASIADDGEGGGIASGGDNATVTDNIIVDNTASKDGQGYGGGIILQGNGLSVQGNTILRNIASVDGEGYGGGMALQWVAGAYLEANVIISNTATLSATAIGHGGGVFGKYGQVLTWTNNIVAANQANTSGSGLYFVANLWNPGDANLRHTTIAANRGAEGVYVGPYSTLAFTNTILVSHTVGISVTAGSTATLEATLWGSGPWANGADWGGDGTIITGTVNLWGDPAFLAPDDGNYHIRAGSAARDAGVDAGVITDIDDDPRPLGQAPDIGADEARAVYLPVVLRGF